MKRQSIRDRLDEGEGMVRSEMRSERSSRGMYRHEVDMPSEPAAGRLEHGMGCHEFKGQADSIAYGQAGRRGCDADSKKIMSQMMHYDWDDSNSGY